MKKQEHMAKEARLRRMLSEQYHQQIVGANVPIQF
jgi:hypothetical protein